MKNVVLKRIFASTLAGALALALPLTAMAENGGEGGTVGEADLITGEGDFFSVVLPTNTASNVNFQIDPNHMLSEGKIDGVDKTLYQENVQLYFTRTNYADMVMGNKGESETDAELKKYKASAAYYWGSVNNQKVSEAVGDKMFGNTSNWMTITNKSAKPVTVELKVNWENTNNVNIVAASKDLKDSTDAAIYMEVQAAEGYTDDHYNKIDKNLSLISEAAQLKEVYEWENPEAPAEEKKLQTLNIPLATSSDKTKTQNMVWVLPTVNQYYATLHPNAKYVASVQDLDELQTKEQAYYLRAYYENQDGAYVLGGYELWNNRDTTWTSNKYKESAKVYGKTEANKYFVLKDVSNADTAGTFNGYDASINVYPTYAFRLSGDASVKGWSDETVMPKIVLSWKVTVGEPDEKKEVVDGTAVVWDGISNVRTDKEIDIKGVIDDKQYYYVETDPNSKLESISVVAGTYKNDTLWVNDGSKNDKGEIGKPEEVNTNGFLNAGTLKMMTVKPLPDITADDNKTVLFKKYQVNLNQILLLNYSQAKFFIKKGNDRQKVTFTFHFVDENKKTFTKDVTLMDTLNKVQ